MIEKKLISQFPAKIIAVDEVGRGPLCGPVVIGAVAITINDRESLNKVLRKLNSLNITDSKKLKNSERFKILQVLGFYHMNFKAIKEIELAGFKIKGVVWDLSAQMIDEENILAASLRGMKEAALALSDVKKNDHVLLIDGPHRLRWGEDQSPFEEIPIIKGDSKSLLIGLASILAKVHRDEFMEELHEQIPDFDLHKNYGYPTKKHREALQKLGPTEWHRKTFKGVKELL